MTEAAKRQKTEDNVTLAPKLLEVKRVLVEDLGCGVGVGVCVCVFFLVEADAETR